MSGVLSSIVARARVDLQARKAALPLAALERLAANRAPRGDRFREALARPRGLNVIAECKRRSPSKGVLRADYEPSAIARAYERAGAAAISVLTEPAFFDGSLEHLAEVRAAVSLPLLRKDFVVDPYQLFETRAAGADAVLLIVAILDGAALWQLLSVARALGLEALVEVHDEAELDRAIEAGASVVGVNNRNLRTLEVDLETGSRLVAGMPAGVVAVAESGIGCAGDLVSLDRLGYHAFLIGERLVTASDPGAALEELLDVAEGLRHHP